MGNTHPAARLLCQSVHNRVGAFPSEAKFGRLCALQVLEGRSVGLRKHAGSQHPQRCQLLLALLGCALSSYSTRLCTALPVAQPLDSHPQCGHLHTP